MREIKELAKKIKCEIHDADEYIDLALKYREKNNRALAEAYFGLAKGELEDADTLHEQVVRMIREYPEDPPKVMQELWEYEHEMILEDTNEVNRKIEMYRNGSTR